MNDVITFKQTNFKQKIKSFCKSKFIVVITLLLFCLGLFGTAGKANSDNIDLSEIYQYFLLDNQNGYNDDDKGKGSISNPVGYLGSGGNHGDFSYSDIVEGAGKDQRQSAKQFAGTMATLSGYHYFDVSSEGIYGWLNKAGTFFIGLILVPFGLVEDLGGMVYSLFQNVAQYSVISMLGDMFANTSTGSKLAQAFGISKDLLSSIVTIGTNFVVIMLILGATKALSHEDAFSMSRWKKTIQRLIGWVSLPVILGLCSTIIAEFTPENVNVGKQNPAFANYIIDVKTWAERDNFDMYIGGANGISGSNKDGTYLDPDYNPYKDNGKKTAKIGQALYQQSALNGTAFPNTAMAIGILSNNSFNASDYLSYIQTTNGFNGVKNALTGFSKDNYKALYTFDKGYTSTGVPKDNWKNGDDTPMVKAKDDYGSNKEQKQSPTKTWVDRYIYGAKSSGNLDDYYKQTPSKEQVYAGFGGRTNNGTMCLSDASMFLALNTKFNVNGGTFSLNTPAKGVKGTIASFSYQTPVWSSYSLVGNPLYTLPKMLSGAIFTMIVLIASLIALLRIGLIEMNIDPFRAWLKAGFKGDLEYVEAVFVYTLGIVGTIFTMTYIAPLASKGINAILSALFNPLTQGLSYVANSNVTPTVNGTELIGLSGILSFAIALVALHFFRKDPKFRAGVVEILTVPWTWASDVGHRLESMADGNTLFAAKDRINKAAGRHNRRKQAMGNFGSNVQAKAKKADDFLRHLAKSDSLVGRSLNAATGGTAGKIARGAIAAKRMLDPNDNADTTGGLTKKNAISRDMKVDGAKQRLENALAKIPPEQRLNGNVDKLLDEAENQDFKPNEDGMLNADDPRLTAEEQQEAQAINEEQEALDKEQAEIDKARQELERKHDEGEISDEEYEKQKAELEQRQAEHDLKQNKLDGRRNQLMDAINGTASLDNEGKFNVDNPNFTEEQRAEAQKLNDNQDEINTESKKLGKRQADIDKDKEQLAHDKELYQKQKTDMTPAQRKEAQRRFVERQRDINARQSELDNKREALKSRQQGLNEQKSDLMARVKADNEGRTFSAAEREKRKHSIAGLAEQARIASADYQKAPTPDNAANVVNTLQSMKQEAQRLGKTTKDVYGFDVDRQIRSIQQATPTPAKSSRKMMQINENDDGTMTVMSQGIGANNSQRQSSIVSKYATKTTKNLKTPVSKQSLANNEYTKDLSYPKATKSKYAHSTKKHLRTSRYKK